MAARFPRPTPQRESAQQLRAHTSSLLQAITSGRAPLIAAELNVSKARVQNQVAGDCANPLELLYRWLDRAESEGAERRHVAAIVRDFADRFGCDLAPRPMRALHRTSGVLDAASAAAREIGEALAVSLDRCATDAQKDREVQDAIERLHALRAAIAADQHQQAGMVPA